MNKFILVSTKKLKRKYFIRILAIIVPFFQLDLILGFVFCIDKSISNSLDNQIMIYKLLILTSGILLLILILGLFSKYHLIKAHTKHTFVEFIGSYLVVSIHHETTFGFRKTYYKNLYVMKLSDFESGSLIKGKLTLNGKLRSFYDKSDRLHYSYIDNEFKFDEWWYDYNCLKEVKYVTIPNMFDSPAKILKTARSLSALEKAKLERRRQYHEQMMNRASTPHKTTRIPRTVLFRNEKR